jgi:N-methylhydantoinase A
VSDAVSVRWRAELRYAGQGFELPVELRRDSAGLAEAGEIRKRFEDEYRRTYGHELKSQPIDFVALRVIATVPPRGVRALTRLRPVQHSAPTAPSRQAYFGREPGLLETPVIVRRELGASPRPGPLIVEEYEGTTVVPPRASAALDAYDNIVITLEGERTRVS